MRECFNSYCHKGKETEWVDDGTDAGKTVVTKEDCHICDGSGEVEDHCYCSALCSCECCCGAWDDTECMCWEY